MVFLGRRQEEAYRRDGYEAGEGGGGGAESRNQQPEDTRETNQTVARREEGNQLVREQNGKGR